MVDLQAENVVAVLTRAPSAGGKSRLFAGLGRAPDADLLAAFLLDTLDAVALPRIARVACFTPATAEPEVRALVPSDVQVLAQRGDDLGDRMRFAFDDLFASGAHSIVLVGSDLPGIDPETVSAALDALHRHPPAVVLGPARDGGYYLIGATYTPGVLLAGITWSRPDVLDQTERQARSAGIEIIRMAAACDIDTVEDLRALLRSSAPAVRTRALCRTIW